MQSIGQGAELYIERYAVNHGLAPTIVETPYDAQFPLFRKIGPEPPKHAN
jgi:hypothetical protein